MGRSNLPDLIENRMYVLVRKSTGEVHKDTDEIPYYYIYREGEFVHFSVKHKENNSFSVEEVEEWVTKPQPWKLVLLDPVFVDEWGVATNE